MDRWKKVIFVSDDDTYRSPIAAAYFNKYATRLGIHAESRGNVVLFGEPPNPKGVDILKEEGINISGYSSKQLSDADFSDETLFIAMTDKNKVETYSAFPSAGNIYTLKEFIGGTGDIDVPFGKGMDEYKDSILAIKQLVMQVISKMQI